MSIDPRKFEWNLNTLISTMTLVVMLGGWIYYWANTVRDIEDLKEWRETHGRTVEGRLAESREMRGKTEERIKSAEKSAVETERRVDQTVYRVTVLETSLASQQVQQQKVSDDLSEVKGDLKVVKEILLRQDAASKRRTP